VGLNTTARQLGGALGVAMLAAILEAADPGPSGYRVAFALCGAAAAIVALAALATLAGRSQLPRRGLQPASASRPSRNL
jgi:sugar phosphate permease